MQSADILVNEVHLGDKVSRSVNQNRSGDFAMLMAMMSQNVLDNAQFSLPSESPGAEDITEQRLRETLGLAQPVSYTPDDNSASQSILLGVDLHTEGLSEVKLKGYLQPEPLAMHDDAMHIDAQVLDNCEPVVRKRLELNQDSVAPKLEHNPAGLYEVLQDLHQAA